jgi:hypothetical protein
VLNVHKFRPQNILGHQFGLYADTYNYDTLFDCQIDVQNRWRTNLISCVLLDDQFPGYCMTFFKIVMALHLILYTFLFFK